MESTGSPIDIPPHYRPAHAPIAPPWHGIDKRPQDPLSIGDSPAKFDGGIVAAAVKETHPSADLALFLIGEVEQVREARAAHRKPFACLAVTGRHCSSNGGRLSVGIHRRPPVGFGSAIMIPFREQARFSYRKGSNFDGTTPIVTRPSSDLAPGASGIAARLKQARAHSGITIRALAKSAGIASSAITDTEIGDRIPRADTLEKMARALNVSACWLAYGEGNAPVWLDTEAGDAAKV